MKYLKEVSKIVTLKKVRKIEIFDEHFLKQKTSKFNEFYLALASGKLDNDLDAAQLMYGNISPTDDKYRQLKSRFKKRLYNSLFFLDVNAASASNYNHAYFSCNKEWTQVKILQSYNSSSAAEQLARHILTTALKFEFSDIIVNCSRVLRKGAMNEENDKQYEFYDNCCKKYQEILNSEIESEELYQRTLLNYKKPKAKSKDLEDMVKGYCQILKQLSSEYNSPVNNFNRFVVSAIYHEIKGNYEKVLNICEAAEHYIIEHPQFYREEKQAEIAQKKMLALMHLKNFEKGKEQAEQYLKIFEEDQEWFGIMEKYLLLSVHSKNYDTARELFCRVFEDKRYKSISGNEKEKWKTIEAYLCFLTWFETENEAKKPKRFKQFRVRRFLEEPIIFPKGKRIFTVLLVIGQVLFLLEEGRTGEAYERIERLKGYANRLLKREEHFRIIQFVRLLQQLAKADFNYENIGVHQKYYDRLEESPMKYRGYIDELEIIPYQDLWEMVLETVSKQVVELV
jgi:hypothetical protein